MELHEGIALIRHPSLGQGEPQTWADLGCGGGFFTEALAALLPAHSHIYAVDRQPTLALDLGAARSITVQRIRADFVRDQLPIRKLDGILMANSLHYVRDQAAFLADVQHYLNTAHRFLIVEYERDQANPWVPYPLSFRKLRRLFEQTGDYRVQKLQERSSRRGFDAMYAALIQHNDAENDET